MKELITDILLGIIIAAEIAAGVHFYIEDRKAAEAVWFDSYPMANQQITWEGAGYQKLTGSEAK